MFKSSSKIGPDGRAGRGPVENPSGVLDPQVLPEG